MENNITHVAITKLLKGLKAYTHEDLPTEARTLLQTPQTTSMINTASGTCYYHGLKRALEDHLQHTRSVNIENPIRINLSIDGLPLAKSSKVQFWPLLGQIVHIDYREEPCVIAVYHGYCKPAKPNLMKLFIILLRNILKLKKKDLIIKKKIMKSCSGKSIYEMYKKPYRILWMCGINVKRKVNG